MLAYAPKAQGSRATAVRAPCTKRGGVCMRSQALTAVLELLSLGAVRAVCRKKGGAKLYAQGVACNFLNNAVLGPPTYELVANRWMAQPFTPLGRACMILAIVWGHSVGEA